MRDGSVTALATQLAAKMSQIQSGNGKPTPVPCLLTVKSAAESGETNRLFRS